MNAPSSNIEPAQIHPLPAMVAAPARRRRRALLSYDQRLGLFIMLVGVGLIAVAALAS